MYSRKRLVIIERIYDEPEDLRVEDRFAFRKTVIRELVESYALILTQLPATRARESRNA